ncbi:MAG: PAS domain-containing sensor histidine kinase [Bacteroidales bacterium]|jgi:PAS domain S-box-containing protein|nr:PAS domain-containing sensor histidine kinase [Bacteroidales bacterium]
MTERKNLIENINLLTILEDIPVGMILLDEDGHIILANSIFLNIFSYNVEDLTGKAIGDILSLPAEERKKNPLPGLSQISSLPKHIVEIKNKKGKDYHLKFRLYDSGSGHTKLYAGFVLGNRDSNDLKNELDRQIKIKYSLQDKLEEEGELSDLKSRFLSIASHEFRTPLAGILSSINLITRYLEADQELWSQFRNQEKVSNHLKKINESVKNLTTILDRFLALGNIEQGEIPIRMVRFNIVQALKLQSKQFEELCKPGQKIIYRHSGQKTSVYLDKNLLKNIMNNLFSNAIRFSPENSELKLFTKVTAREVRIELADEGIGIPKADQNNIFRRFYRAKNALTFQDGTGLGLSIVKKYVDLMKGNISFDSEENIGTTFYITFPNKTL